MVKKNLILIHRVDIDYEVIVGCFTSRRDLYTGWKNYLKEYIRIEKREAIERLKLNLGKEVRSDNDTKAIKKDREILDRIEEGSFLCHDKAKRLFYVNLVPKNSIRFDREPFELEELFPTDPICPWCSSSQDSERTRCLNLEYQSSSRGFDMEHIKLEDEEDKSTLVNLEQLKRWWIWVDDWVVWFLGLPSVR